MTGWNGRRLSEEGKVTSPESTVLLAIVPSLRHRYLIVRHENRGLELPHLFLNPGEEVLPYSPP